MRQTGSRATLAQLHASIVIGEANEFKPIHSKKRVLTGRIVTKLAAEAHLLKLTLQQKQIIHTNCAQPRARKGKATAQLSPYITSLTHNQHALLHGLYFIDRTGIIPCVLEWPMHALVCTNLALTDYTLALAYNNTFVYTYLEIKQCYQLDAILSRRIHCHEGFDWANFVNYAIDQNYPTMEEVVVQHTASLQIADGDAETFSLAGRINSKTLVRVINDTHIFSVKLTSTRILSSHHALELECMEESSTLTAFIECNVAGNDQQGTVHALHQQILVGCSYLFDRVKACKIALRRVEVESGEYERSFRFDFDQSTISRLDDGPPQSSKSIAINACKLLLSDINCLVGDLHRTTSIVDCEATVTGVLNSDIGVYSLIGEEGSISKLFLCEDQSATTHLGLRIGSKIYLHGVHCIRNSYSYTPEIPSTTYIACDHSTIEVLRMSETSAHCTLSNLKQRRAYFHSWRDLNHSEITLMEDLRVLFEQRSIAYDGDTFLNLTSVLGRRPRSERVVSLHDHNATCDVAKLSFVLPEMPSLATLLESIGSDLSGYSQRLTDVFQESVCLTGMLTRDGNGNSYLVNGERRCLLLFVVAEQQAAMTVLEYGHIYCILDCTVCSESFASSLLNKRYARSYLAVNQQHMMTLSTTGEPALSESVHKRTKQSELSGFLFKITRIGSVQIDKHSTASLHIHATLYNITFTNLPSYSIKTMQQGVMAYIKIYGKHIAAFLTCASGSSFLMHKYAESMDVSDTKTPELIQKCIVVVEESWIKFVDVVMEYDGTESSIYLESIQSVTAFNDELHTSAFDALTMIDVVYERISQSESPLIVNVEGIITHKEYAIGNGMRLAYTESDWLMFKDRNIGSGNVESSILLTLSSPDSASTLKVYYNLKNSLYPLGLLAGSRVRITGLCVQKSVNGSSVYGTVTPESRISIISVVESSCITPRSPLISCTATSASRTLRQSKRLLQPHRHFLCNIGKLITGIEAPSILTIEYIKELKLFLICSKCKAKVSSSACDRCASSTIIPVAFQSQAFQSQALPRDDQSFEVGGKATLSVYDGTSSVFLNLHNIVDIIAACMISHRVLAEVDKYVRRYFSFEWVKEWVDWNNSQPDTPVSKTGFDAVIDDCVGNLAVKRSLRVMIKPRNEDRRVLVTGWAIPIETIWFDEHASTARRKKGYYDGYAVQEIDYRGESRKLIDRLNAV